MCRRKFCGTGIIETAEFPEAHNSIYRCGAAGKRVACEMCRRKFCGTGIIT